MKKSIAAQIHLIRPSGDDETGVSLDLIFGNVFRHRKHLAVMLDLFIGQVGGATFPVVGGDKKRAGVNVAVYVTISLHTDELCLLVPGNESVVVEGIGYLDITADGMLERLQAVLDHRLIRCFVRLDNDHSLSVADRFAF